MMKASVNITWKTIYNKTLRQWFDCAGRSGAINDLTTLEGLLVAIKDVLRVRRGGLVHAGHPCNGFLVCILLSHWLLGLYRFFFSKCIHEPHSKTNWDLYSCQWEHTGDIYVLWVIRVPWCWKRAGGPVCVRLDFNMIRKFQSKHDALSKHMFQSWCNCNNKIIVRSWFPTNTKGFGPDAPPNPWGVMIKPFYFSTWHDPLCFPNSIWSNLSI